MKENNNKMISIPKLTKGQSAITPGEDNQYTIKKGKAVKNKTETKRVVINLNPNIETPQYKEQKNQKKNKQTKQYNNTAKLT